MIVETYEYKGFKINVEQDQDPQNPREEFENVAVIACFHKKDRYGDQDHGFTPSEYGSRDELEGSIRTSEDVAAILPVYMYSHSGVTISTTPFACPWGSGQVGYAWITKDKAKKEYGWKRFTPKRIAKLEALIRQEVKTYDDYLTGAVYAIDIINPDGETVDSCSGYFGGDSVAENGYAVNESKLLIDNIEVKWNEAKRVAALPENRPDQLSLGLQGVP